MNQNGTKCKQRASNCRWHKSVTCPICLDDIQYKDVHTTSCSHKFHTGCILRWFVTSDDCPICRTEQAEDPMIVFKRTFHENLSRNYMDAIRSLESDVTRYRRRLRALRDF